MTGTGDFTTPAFVPGVGFHPDMYGYKGVWPTGRWGIAQRQYSAAYHLASGRALEKKDKREDMAIYPLQINLWDFIAEVHATMIVGEGANSPPQTNYIGEGVWEKSRAKRYSQMIKDTWSASDDSMFWTIFYNTQVFGGYGVIVRLTPERHHPLRYEAISPFSFYPIMDSNYNIIEFFIHRRITHSEARWNYGVTIKPDEEVYYTEHWNPEKYDVRINGQRAHYKNGDPMVGSNPFGVAPAVYIPHIRKTSEWGDSQILGVKQMVLDFNARIADVSDAVRDGMLARYWGYNLETPRRIYVGRTPIYSFGNSSDSRTQPQINAITGSHAIKEGADYANMLWDLILRVPENKCGAICFRRTAPSLLMRWCSARRQVLSLPAAPYSNLGMRQMLTRS